MVIYQNIITLDQTNKIISHTYNLNSNTTDITELLNDVKKDGYKIKDINTCLLYTSDAADE